MISTSWPTLLKSVGRALGWPSGRIYGGDANSATLEYHIGAFGDDAALQGWTIIMPETALFSDRFRTIEYWDDSAGKVTWVTARTDTDPTTPAETYLLAPPGDYTYRDIFTAAEDCLSKTRFTSVVTIPTLNDVRSYPLGDLTWLRGRDDVDAVYYRRSPNLLSNSQFENWGDGTTQAPVGWYVVGASITIDEATAPVGYRAANLTSTLATAELSRIVSVSPQFEGASITFGAWVRSFAATTTRLRIQDDSADEFSSYHTGGGSYEWLTVTKTITTTQGQVLASVMDTSGANAWYVANAVAVEGTAIPDALRDSGDTAYRLLPISHRVRQIGDQISIELDASVSRGAQLVVYSGQNYAPFDINDTVTASLCPEDVLVAGTLYELTSRMKKGQDRTRLEMLMARNRQEYLALSRSLREYPVIQTHSPVQVIGA